MTPLANLSAHRDDPRTLVVVFLRGAADGLTLVAPIGDDNYHNFRPRLAVKKSDAVPLDGFFGLHPNLRPLEAAWKDGDLAIAHGAGVEDESRSHFEAQDFMEHGGVVAGGWLARFLRARGPSAGPLSAVALAPTLPEMLSGAPSVVVMTEFGRRVAENSAFGTDHGRGGAMFVMGGGVKGGRVLGGWPGLRRELLDSPGDLPVWNNYRNVLAPILQRHGAAPDSLSKIFPNFALAPLGLY